MSPAPKSIKKPAKKPTAKKKVANDHLYLGGICFITDRCACDLTCLEMCRMVLERGIRWVQYRDKDRSRSACFSTALALRELTSKYGAKLIINDHADIAAAVGADGVHLGQEDMPVSVARRLLGPDKIIGVSTHNYTEALVAINDGASYIGFGPVYPTTTKKKSEPVVGLEMLAKICSRVSVPVVAIGGISAERLSEVLSSGARAVAVASGIVKGDICRNTRSFLDCVQSRAGKGK